MSHLRCSGKSAGTRIDIVNALFSTDLPRIAHDLAEMSLWVSSTPGYLDSRSYEDLTC